MKATEKTAMQTLLDIANMDGYNRPNWWWKEQITNLLEKEKEQHERTAIDLYKEGVKQLENGTNNTFNGGEWFKQYYKSKYEQ